MAFNHSEWLSSLKTKHPDIEIPKEAEDGWMRQSEYDRKFNLLKQEHDERMRAEDQYHNQLASAEEKLKLVQRLEKQFGPAENWSDTLASALAVQHPELLDNSNPNQSLDVRQVEQLVQRIVSPLQEQLVETRQLAQNVGAGAAVMIDFMDEAKDRWSARYGTKFPKKEFSEFFNSKKYGTDPFTAFEIFEKPYYEKHIEAQHKKAIEDAERKGYQSAMSKHGIAELPATGPGSPNGLFFTPTNTPVQQSAPVDPANPNPNPTPAPSPDLNTSQSHEQLKAKVGSSFVKALDSYNRSGGSSPST